MDIYQKIAARDFDAAKRILGEEQAIRRPDYDYLKGTICLATGDFRDALEHLQKAWNENPGDASTLFNLGRALLVNHRTVQAVKAFEQLVEMDREFPGAILALANAYRRDARYADAVSLIDQQGANIEDPLILEKGKSLHSLGRVSEAYDVFHDLTKRNPKSAKAWFSGHAPAIELHGINAALAMLKTAIQLQVDSSRYWTFLATYLLIFGRHQEVNQIEQNYLEKFPSKKHLLDSVRALMANITPSTVVLGSSATLLTYALSKTEIAGSILEFGVRRGTSIRHLAFLTSQKVHGFDSFEGIPDSWGAEPVGAYTTESEVPSVPQNVELHVGWFDDTLPNFIADNSAPVKLINIDCDIYSSTKTVLDLLAEQILPGSVIVFDELIGNRTWQDDEYRALNEFSKQFSKRWEVIAISPYTKQVAIKIVD